MELISSKVHRWSFDAYTLKMIAIVTMVIDHVGALFFPDVMIFRMIGRLTAPIFAFFIAEGYRKTRNVNKYMMRLGLFAVISMIPYGLVFQHSYFNILFDFLIGLLVLRVTDRISEEWVKWVVVAAGAGFAFWLQTDGMLGISVLVYLCHRYRESPRKLAVSASILYLFPVVMLICKAVFSHDLAKLGHFGIWIRPLALLSLVFIFSYNGEKGKSMKYLFYWFYPVHLMILYVMYQWV